MSINTFYSLSPDERLVVLKRHGEYISSMLVYDYLVHLYIYEGFYVEVYYNQHSRNITEVELLDPKDQRLHQYAVPVNLCDLHQK